MNTFLHWLASSPLASAVKISVAAGLAYILGNVGSFHLDPVVQVVITAGLPVIINWLNPADSRYGRGA